MPTKLGAHVMRTAADVADYIRARPAVVKFVGSWGMAKDVPEGVLVIGRKHQGNYDAQHQRSTGETPAEAARRFIGDQEETYKANPYIEYWEGHNEPAWGSEEEMAWYARFEIERMKMMAEMGLKCVIGNFATGTPPLELWPAFLPALRAALKYEALLGLHEYSCPWMWWMTGKYQLDPNADEGDEGWTTLRYRKVYRQHLIPNGLGDLPLVITECGIDPMVNPKPPNTPAKTWKHLGKFWAEHDNEHDPADYYFRQLVWYDKELQKDDYVVGATVFTWGSFGTWADFDIAGTPVAKKLIAYTKQDPARPFSYKVGGEIVPDRRGDDEQPPARRDRGAPRVQYKRTYVLLPPTAGAEWARAAVKGMWEEGPYTIGSSADDAGIGDLDERRVIAVNPHEWPGPQSLEEFYKKYYPGIKYEPVTAATPEELTAKLPLFKR